MTDNLQKKQADAAFGVVCLLFGGPDRFIVDGQNRKWKFEDHHYCGPIVVGKNGDPIKEPPENSPFWDAVNLWYAQGKRTRQIVKETWCVWDRPTLRKMQHIGGRNYLLMPDDETHNAELCGGPSGPSERAPG